MSIISKFQKFHSKNYKALLVIPLVLFLLSILFLGYFWIQNNDLIKRDISLTGGTSITIFSENQINLGDLKDFLSSEIEDYAVRELTDFRTGEQKAVIVESTTELTTLKPLLEGYLGITFDNENSSIESTGSGLGEGFYLQLIYAIILSFSFMAIVVFFIFGGNIKPKIIIILITIIPFILFISKIIDINTAIIVSSVILFLSVLAYLKYSVPSAAVVTSAFLDIVMTLAVVNLFGMKISSAGIIAFLMLIGYSVDSDIMLTTRLLKRRSEEKRLFNAFKTGITMTLTSIIAISVALFITQGFSEVLRQIFTILLIGLGFDILNTWITNVSILKWYLEARRK